MKIQVIHLTLDDYVTQEFRNYEYDARMTLFAIWPVQDEPDAKVTAYPIHRVHRIEVTWEEVPDNNEKVN